MGNALDIGMTIGTGECVMRGCAKPLLIYIETQISFSDPLFCRRGHHDRQSLFLAQRKDNAVAMTFEASPIFSGQGRQCPPVEEKKDQR
jgi:hypothetical protein